MSRWVSVFERIIVGIAVAIIILRVSRIRHNRIRAHKPGDAGQIVAGIVVDEAEVVVVLLAGVAAVGVGLAGRGAVAAEGLP